MDRTHQITESLSHQSSALTQLLSALQAEITNINDIYTSYKPIIIPAINHLATDPSFDGNSKYNRHAKRSLLPFLGHALSWLTGAATTKDIITIKKRVNQLIAAQSIQQEAIVNIVSILNITRYTAQVNRQHIDIIMDTVDKTAHNVNNLYNITFSLSTSSSYNQLVLHIRSVLGNLQDSLSYVRTVFMHTMDYVNAATKDHFHPTSYPLQVLSRCYPTLRRHYLLPCIYQCHLRIVFTFKDTYGLMF